MNTTLGYQWYIYNLSRWKLRLCFQLHATKTDPSVVTNVQANLGHRLICFTGWTVKILTWASCSLLDYGLLTTASRWVDHGISCSKMCIIQIRPIIALHLHWRDIGTTDLQTRITSTIGLHGADHQDIFAWMLLWMFSIIGTLARFAMAIDL